MPGSGGNQLALTLMRVQGSKFLLIECRARQLHTLSLNYKVIKSDLQRWIVSGNNAMNHQAPLDTLAWSHTRAPYLQSLHKHSHVFSFGRVAPQSLLAAPGLTSSNSRYATESTVCYSSSDRPGASGASSSTALVSQKSAAKRKVGVHTGSWKCSSVCTTL